MKISAGSDVGKRRGSNQDAYAIGELPGGGAWAVVCDGMGGHAGGNVASEMAVQKISSDIKTNLKESMSVLSVKNILESAIVSANIDIYDKAANDPSLFGMGTTVVAAVCMNGWCVAANVGDSRCYLVSENKIAQITKDHSLVQEMVDSGMLTPEQAEYHPKKNIITRALGIEDDVTADFVDTNVSQGDMLLLCSDGLSNMVSNEQIIECTSDPDVFNYSSKLISLANEHGGTDNITAVVLVV